MNTVTDKSGDRRYFSMIPHLVDDAELDPYAFRLYCALKRIAGANNRAERSTRYLAKHCRMSVGKVHDAKQQLAAAKLICIHSDGYTDEIELLDIWRENVLRYAPDTESGKEKRSPDEQDAANRSPHERSSGERSSHEQERSPHERDSEKRSPHEQERSPHEHTEEVKEVKKERVEEDVSFMNNQEDFLLGDHAAPGAKYTVNELWAAVKEDAAAASDVPRHMQGYKPTSMQSLLERCSLVYSSHSEETPWYRIILDDPNDEDRDWLQEKALFLIRRTLCSMLGQRIFLTVQEEEE